MSEHTIEGGKNIADPPANCISFTVTKPDGPKLLFTIKPDGEIEFGPAFTTKDEASLAFWRLLVDCFPTFLEQRQGLMIQDDE